MIHTPNDSNKSRCLKKVYLATKSSIKINARKQNLMILSRIFGHLLINLKKSVAQIHQLQKLADELFLNFKLGNFLARTWQ